MSRYASHLSKKNSVTPQSLPIVGREAEMAQNDAGGYVFTVDQWDYLDRFLILGAEGGSYYVSERELTVRNAGNVLKCIKDDGVRSVNQITQISDSGRAAKNDPAIFALALAAINGDEATVKQAYEALPKVCRIGTHLFQFVATLNELGKWNKRAKAGVANWYLGKNLDNMAYQMLKYQQRNGWAHRDVLRLAHVKPDSLERSAMFKYSVKGELTEGVLLPAIVEAVRGIHAASGKEQVDLATMYINSLGVSMEMLPTELLNIPDIWEALLAKGGITMVIRNLGRLGALGLLNPLSANSKQVIARLSNADDLTRSRVHPIQLLSALKVYGQGYGERGNKIWSVNQAIVDALDDAFYASFGNVPTTGRNFLLGVDCSGSMFGATVMGIPGLTAADVAGVMALAIAKREPNYWIGGFNSNMSELKISPNMPLGAALKVIRGFSWGSTDCSAPMRYAKEHKMDVDVFCTITDNETWSGRMQPAEALRDYRKAMKKPMAASIVAATSGTNFTIADPKDPGMLDICGFDASCPRLIAEF